MKHFLLGGSSASRWMACPGSVKLIASLPRQPGGAAANRGTMLHEMVGRVINGASPESLVGKVHESVVLTAVDAKTALLPAAAAYRRFTALVENAKLEVRVKLGAYVGGTADIIGHRKGIGYVGDFKFGAGIVPVASNPQLMLYAAGALAQKLMPAHTVVIRLAIIQPAARRVLEEDEVPVKRVREFGHEVRRIAKIALAPGAALVPGDKQCEWCPAEKADICPAVKALRATAQPDLAKSLLTLGR